MVFVPVAANSAPYLDAKTPAPSNPFDGGLPMFGYDSVDFLAARRPSAVAESSSPMRSVNGRGDCFVVSPTSAAAERSTPLKPAKRDRSANADDRQILRCCKRSLAASLTTAATSRPPDGGSQTSSSSSSSSTSTFGASESVERRNLRERRRVKLINVTFATLRNRLPSYCWQQQRQQQRQQRQHRRQRGDTAGRGGSSKRPSKVDTLRTAISYIRCLQDLLADDDRQRLTTFQTFDSTNTVDRRAYWTTSPSTAVGYDSCSPATSTSCSSVDDLTTSAACRTAALTADNGQADFTDEILDRHVNESPITDILDWLI